MKRGAAEGATEDLEGLQNDLKSFRGFRITTWCDPGNKRQLQK